MSASLPEQARDQLRKALDELGLNPSSACRQTSIDKRTLQRILSGEMVPTLGTYEKVLSELGYEVILEARPII